MSFTYRGGGTGFGQNQEQLMQDWKRNALKESVYEKKETLRTLKIDRIYDMLDFEIVGLYHLGTD